MTTATLPRKVQTSEHWPTKLIVQIGGHQPCANCPEEIAYYHDQNLGGDWVHTGTERIVCATERFNIADPAPRCPKCRSHNVTWTEQEWGNAQDCPDCGHHAFHSIDD